jgi:hypothetical protein
MPSTAYDSLKDKEEDDTNQAMKDDRSNVLDVTDEWLEWYRMPDMRQSVCPQFP